MVSVAEYCKKNKELITENRKEAHVSRVRLEWGLNRIDSTIWYSANDLFIYNIKARGLGSISVINSDVLV